MKPGIHSKTNSTVCKKNGIVEALVINNPDLSLYLKLQNLLNYFLECLNLIASSSQNEQCAEHLHICIDHIKIIGTEKIQ